WRARAALVLQENSSDPFFFLAPGSEIHLAVEGVARRGDVLGPVGRVRLRTQVRRARSSVPSDLLHVVIELDRVAVRIDGERRIVDAGRKFGRKVAHAHARALQEGNRVAKLPVVGELQAE